MALISLDERGSYYKPAHAGCMSVGGGFTPKGERGSRAVQGFGAAGAPSGDFNITFVILSSVSCNTEQVFEVNRSNHFDLAIPEVILSSAQTHPPSPA